MRNQNFCSVVVQKKKCFQTCQYQKCRVVIVYFFFFLLCRCTLNLFLCLCFLLRSGEEQSPPAICRQHIFRCGARPKQWCIIRTHLRFSFHVFIINSILYSRAHSQVAISPRSVWTSRSGQWRSMGRRWSYRSGTQQGRNVFAPSPQRKWIHSHTHPPPLLGVFRWNFLFMFQQLSLKPWKALCGPDIRFYMRKQ